MQVFIIILLACILIIAGFVVISLIYILMKPRNNPSAFLKKLRNGRINAKKERFACIGDSITHGHVSEDYTKLLRKRFESKGKSIEIINAGINSEHAYNVLQRIDEIISCKPDFVSILIGTNDSNNSINAKRWNRAIKLYDLPEKPSIAFYKDNLEKIMRRLKKETKARICILSLPTNGEKPDDISFQRGIEFNKVIKDMAARMDIEYLPLYKRMASFLKEHPANTKCNSDNQDEYMIKGILKHRFGRNYEKISKDIGCQFHVDFLHLNKKGATLIVDLLEAFYFNEDK